MRKLCFIACAVIMGFASAVLFSQSKQVVCVGSNGACDVSPAFGSATECPLTYSCQRQSGSVSVRACSQCVWKPNWGDGKGVCNWYPSSPVYCRARD